MCKIIYIRGNIHITDRRQSSEQKYQQKRDKSCTARKEVIKSGGFLENGFLNMKSNENYTAYKDFKFGDELKISIGVFRNWLLFIS